jgi:hypothetical protein
MGIFFAAGNNYYVIDMQALLTLFYIKNLEII